MHELLQPFAFPSLGRVEVALGRERIARGRAAQARRVSVDVRVRPTPGGWVVEVTVSRSGRTTRHRVTVGRDDLTRYGASDPADLVRRSFYFLLAREPNTQVLREFRVTEIEGYFPEFAEAIRPRPG